MKTEKSFQERQAECSRKVRSLYREQFYAEAEHELMRFHLSCTDDEEKKLSLSMLVGHFHYVANDARALEFLQQAARLWPDDVQAHLFLAEHFHYHDIQLPVALKHVENALALAVLNGVFVRQVLATKLRILLEMKDDVRARDALLHLMTYQPPKGGLDVALEDDFLDKLPESEIDPRLVARYKALAGKHS